MENITLSDKRARELVAALKVVGVKVRRVTKATGEYDATVELSGKWSVQCTTDGEFMCNHWDAKKEVMWSKPLTKDLKKVVRWATAPTMATTMSLAVEDCTLEIDVERGVIYVHGPTGMTLLRVCRLPTPIPVGGSMLDITHMHGASWGAATIEPWTRKDDRPQTIASEEGVLDVENDND